jgi:NADPH2:quinone reductase
VTWARTWWLTGGARISSPWSSRAYKYKEPGAIRDGHAELTKLAAAGLIRPLISERLALSHVPDGLRRLAAGTTTGRIVFIP